MVLEGSLDVIWTKAFKWMSGSLLVIRERIVAGYKDSLHIMDNARGEEQLGESGIIDHEICKLRELGVG